MDVRHLSLWHDQLPVRAARPALRGRVDADVAVVGAGFTGLWTAYHLLRAAPSTRVVLVEAGVAGFGASGRNGGWCSALYPVGAARLAAEVGRAGALAQYAAVRDAVAEVVAVAAAEGIDADVAVGGSVVVARSAAQLERARAEAEEAAGYGLDVELLDADAARARLAATDVVGGTWTPHCAVLQPAKLVRGLADLVTARGAQLFEGTRATAVQPGRVRTTAGEVRADVVVRATEGYTPLLPGLRRAVVPVYSLVVATAPLPAEVWDRIGLRERETFSDHRHLIVYGQRTADGRLVFGGRGAPYHYGSSVRAGHDREPAVFAALERTLVELFPVLAGVPITHRWGGPLGITRDWHPSVGLDRATGMAWAGGYVGDGVATAALAGHTLADLVTGTTTDRTTLPWVGHRSPAWEPEPLRWLGANAGLRAMSWADAAERRGGRPSRTAALVDAVLGR